MNQSTFWDVEVALLVSIFDIATDTVFVFCSSIVEALNGTNVHNTNPIDNPDKNADICVNIDRFISTIYIGKHHLASFKVNITKRIHNHNTKDGRERQQKDARGNWIRPIDEKP